MTDLPEALEKLEKSWDEAAMRKLVREVFLETWRKSVPDAKGLARADVLRGFLKKRLAAAKGPREEFLCLDILYVLEQGMAKRQEALGIARRVADLAGKAASSKERVFAVFQLAKALLYADRTADSVEWSLKGMRLGGEMEKRGEADNDVKRLLADQESRLTVRMVGLGGWQGEIDRAVESSIRRWEALADPAGLAAALGMLAEARLFQGRFQDSANLARRSLAAAGYPEKTDGTAYALWCGALALGRLGDFKTALAWTKDSERVNLECGNAEGAIEARLVRADVLCLSGKAEQALQEIEAIVREVAGLNMGGLSDWAVMDRAWIRMKLGMKTPMDELEALCPERECPARANALYAISRALALSGRDGSKQREEAIALFKKYGLVWHLDRATRGDLFL